ncbi:hypothetical protein KC337_g62 [Hortaea werneckii]|nr:hypothetical protein KC337_g62 [Hortaea werneckii]
MTAAGGKEPRWWWLGRNQRRSRSEPDTNITHPQPSTRPAPTTTAHRTRPPRRHCTSSGASHTLLSFLLLRRLCIATRPHHQSQCFLTCWHRARQSRVVPRLLLQDAWQRY